MTAAAVSLFTLGLLLINVLGARAGKQLLGPLEPTLYAAGMGFGALTVCQVWRACLCRASGRGEKESNVHGWNEYAEG